MYLMYSILGSVHIHIYLRSIIDVCSYDGVFL